MWLVVVCKRINGDGYTAFTFKLSSGDDVLAQLASTFGMSTIKNVWSFGTKKKAAEVAEQFNMHR